MIWPKFKDWIDERYDIAKLKKFAKSKLVPQHRYDFLYYTGGITLFLFILQFITGMLLAFYYIPHIDFAYESIIDIVTKINMGWFFRSLHHWGAQLCIVFVFIHLFGTLLVKSYRKPREFLWVTGFILLVISIFFGLSGYLLLWDERAFAAVRVATGGAGALPFVGSFIKIFLRGGIDVTGDTLTRFYAFHVSILPVFSLLLIGIHLLFVQYHGMSTPVSLEKKEHKEEPFFPNVFYKDIMIWLVVLGVVVTLAILLPPEIGKKANALAAPPEGIKPEWYFLFYAGDTQALSRNHSGLQWGNHSHCMRFHRNILFLSHSLSGSQIKQKREKPRLHSHCCCLSSLFYNHDSCRFF